ncbi:MAG: hypothetical protein LIP03_11580 [Bacteroidales bacterium]|nr:hypothetical protein [Bacteroidales bacterium]
MKNLRIMLIGLLCLGGFLMAWCAAPVWEVVQSEPTSEVVEADRVEVTVKDGYIYVSTPRAVTVKVLSIVGQLISEKNLEPGVARLKIGARGVYILKAGDATLRVSI